jgi:hypothetical protein
LERRWFFIVIPAKAGIQDDLKTKSLPDNYGLISNFRMKTDQIRLGARSASAVSGRAEKRVSKGNLQEAGAKCGAWVAVGADG